MSRRSLSAALLAGLVAVAVPAAVAAQAPATRAAPYKAPRLSNGQPDLQGNWTNVGLTPFERPAQYGDRKVMTPEEVRVIEARRAEIVALGNAPTVGVFDLSTPCHAANFDETSPRIAPNQDCGFNAGWTDHGDRVMRVNGEPRTSLVTSTPNGRPPPRLPRPANAPPPAPRRAGAAFDNPENQTMSERCITSFGNHAGPVLLASFYNNNYQIVQSKDAVAIVVEMIHDARIVRMNAEHGSLRPYYGDSVGRWDGDTLVVETINFHPTENFRGSSSDHLKVIERFTRVGPTRLLYQFTVEDPTVWATPWGGEYEMSPSAGPLFEYACHEGNYGLLNILAGARAEEAQAAARTVSAPAQR